jgi:AraC family transcriptional regulator of adaptative response / DNA-3-methyladenine glycosylase II
MTPSPSRADDDACYLALKARDARFDGNFFTGVTSTGVYCRPVCRVRTPKRENCRFFEQAAQAELAGFRPCLRCRPELAPRQLNGGGPSPWSMQDASHILAEQAAQLIDAPTHSNQTPTSVAALARRLGISERHLLRIFEARFGVTPLRYLQTRRLLTAKQLLTDTTLSLAQIAQISGFGSLRRLNTVFSSQYQLPLGQLRKPGSAAGAATAKTGMTLQLAYRPPYDVPALLRFMAARTISGCEVIDTHPDHPSLATTLRLHSGPHACAGWLVAQFDTSRCRVDVRLSDGLSQAIPQVLALVRSWLDLDADPTAIHHILQADFPHGQALRLPGALDGFALAVRAVLGQQVTLAGARTLCQRLVARYGEPLLTPVPGLDRLFPGPAQLAAASGDGLGQLGITRQRQRALIGLAQAFGEGKLLLQPGADVPRTLAQLQSIPGIGDWTAQYIAMRALAWPDAFPSGDVALQRALKLRAAAHPAPAALAISERWRPWRSYATLRAWATLEP